MTTDTAIDYRQVAADANELAVRVLGLHVSKVYQKMGNEEEFLLRNVDIQAIREFRKVAKEACEAQDEGRDDGPVISQETRDDFEAVDDTHLHEIVTKIEAEANARLEKQKAERVAPVSVPRHIRRANEKRRKRAAGRT